MCPINTHPCIASLNIMYSHLNYIHTHTLFSSSGGKSGSVTTCKKCKGSGIQTMYRQIGPGMVQQMQSQCDDCGGSGDFIREKDRCKKCKGKRLIERDHKLEVGIIVCTFYVLQQWIWVTVCVVGKCVYVWGV